MERFEVIVVGLGAVGSAATYQLTKFSSRVLGIDRFSPPHTLGSTHGGSRITRLAVGEGDDYVPFVRRSQDIWRDLEADSGMNLFRRVGALVVAPVSGASRMHGADDFFASTVDIARRHGIDHDVLGPDELTARFPQFQVGEEYQGYHEPAGGLVLAEAAVGVQLDLARREGATIRTGERVLRIIPASRGAIVETDGGRYGADTVIVSAGPWLPELLSPDLGELFSVYRQVVTWFELDPAERAFAPERCPVYIWQFGDGEEDMFYGFPAIDGADGGVKIGTELYGRPTDPESVRREVDPSEPVRTHRRCLRGRIPALRPRAVRSVSCLYTVAPGAKFVVDFHPEHESIIVASPCSGHGFKHSAAVGEALAELAAVGSSRIDLGVFAIDRLWTRPEDDETAWYRRPWSPDARS